MQRSFPLREPKFEKGQRSGGPRLCANQMTDPFRLVAAAGRRTSGFRKGKHAGHQRGRNILDAVKLGIESANLIAMVGNKPHDFSIGVGRESGVNRSPESRTKSVRNLSVGAI
jgi:hypothetical protein